MMPWEVIHCPVLWNRGTSLGEDKQTALSHRTSNQVWLILKMVPLFNHHGLQFFAEPRVAFGALQCGVWVAMLWATRLGMGHSTARGKGVE